MRRLTNSRLLYVVPGVLGSMLLLQTMLGHGHMEVLPQTGTSDFPRAETVEDIQEMVDFPVMAPPAAPEGFEFTGARKIDAGAGEQVALGFSRVSGALAASADEERGILILQSPDGAGIGNERSGTIQLQGVTATVIEGEDIGNPGLLGVEWEKDGIRLVAVGFPTESFTRADFLDFLETIQ